jgi:hypothetical protein
VTTEIERGGLEAARAQAESLERIADELATLNKTLKLIAETMRGIMARLP